MRTTLLVRVSSQKKGCLPEVTKEKGIVSERKRDGRKGEGECEDALAVRALTSWLTITHAASERSKVSCRRMWSASLAAFGS
jgi:hypothetical protein